MKKLWLICSLLCISTIGSSGQSDSLQQVIHDFLASEKAYQVDLMDFRISMEKRDGENKIAFRAPDLDGVSQVGINGSDIELYFVNGLAYYAYDTDEKGELLLIKHGSNKNSFYRLYHFSKKDNGRFRIKYIPLWLSILPPLVAIVLALIFREVIVSLFIGIWTGSFIAGGLRIESPYYLLTSIMEVVEKYIITALTDSGHMAVIVFSLMIGGMVAIISRNGGMAGVVKKLSYYARSPKSSQFITWLLGVAIFFDDYANTLIVGNTMRAVTDRFRISREKLAYIVDSTAAPVSAIAFITTWIGAELGYIEDGIQMLDGFDSDLSPYAIFIQSLKYSFYPGLTLVFILILIYLQRDYGPMHRAETRARTTGQVSPANNPGEDEPDMEDLSPVSGAPLRWFNAAIPVLAVILMTIFGLFDTGIAGTQRELLEAGIWLAGDSYAAIWEKMPLLYENGTPSFFMLLGKLIGNSDSYVALLWASLSGVFLAILLTISQRIMHFFDTMHTLVTGFKTMLPALIILTLAWSLAACTDELQTAHFLTSALQDNISPFAMPVLIFILSALIAFSTGSSWSTMAILYPIAIPTTWAIAQVQGLDPDISMEILLNVIAVVLAASVLGDHCSPISDTTILSSLASDCNHIDHVRTQLPYAITVGIVSLGAAGLSSYLGGGWGICFMIFFGSVVLLMLFVRYIGKKQSQPIPD